MGLNIFKKNKLKQYNIIITGAGSGGAENLIEDIRLSPFCGTIVGINKDGYKLIDSGADTLYQVAPAVFGSQKYCDDINKIIHENDIDLIIPNNDTEVAIISSMEEHIDCKVFLPEYSTVTNSQDKQTLYETLNRLTPSFCNYCLVDPDWNNQRRWIRLRKGSGSRGSLPVDSKEEADSWVNWWVRHKSVKPDDFMVCEYLPGADYAVQSLWKDGELIIIKIAKRLNYVFGKNMPQGSSSSPSLAIRINKENVVRLVINAVKLMCQQSGEQINGMLSFDIKEDNLNIPYITECNIGRFCMITPIFDRWTEYNMADIYLRLAMNEPVKIDQNILYSESEGKNRIYLIRELDRKCVTITAEMMESIDYGLNDV